MSSVMEKVAPLMARVADGDGDAMGELWTEFQGAFVNVARRVVEGFGRHDLAGDPDELRVLGGTAFLAVVQRAPSWRPEALPWTWCAAAIRSDIAREIGHRSTGTDPSVILDGTAVDALGRRLEDLLDVMDGEPAGSGARAALLPLAEAIDEIGLLMEAVDRVGSPRDADVHLEYGVQKHSGDPSPAITVAQIFSLTPASVRQIDRRMRVKLASLAANEVRYAALTELAWFAA